MPSRSATTAASGSAARWVSAERRPGCARIPCLGGDCRVAVVSGRPGPRPGRSQGWVIGAPTPTSSRPSRIRVFNSPARGSGCAGHRVRGGKHLWANDFDLIESHRGDRVSRWPWSGSCAPATRSVISMVSSCWSRTMCAQRSSPSGGAGLARRPSVATRNDGCDYRRGLLQEVPDAIGVRVDESTVASTVNAGQVSGQETLTEARRTCPATIELVVGTARRSRYMTAMISL